MKARLREQLIFFALRQSCCRFSVADLQVEGSKSRQVNQNAIGELNMLVTLDIDKSAFSSLAPTARSGSSDDNEG